MAKPDVSTENWTGQTIWESGIKSLAAFENSFCKLSGFYEGTKLWENRLNSSVLVAICIQMDANFFNRFFQIYVF